MERLARETGGLIWDEQTRGVFTPDQWNQRRIQNWTDEIPDISTQITIDAYKKTEYVRAITLGMSKFGLPDVVVENSSWSDYNQIGNLINSLCQALAENSSLKKPGEFLLDFKQIKNTAIREKRLTNLYPNATGAAQVGLKYVPLQDGDATNRLMRITFDHYSGKDELAQEDALISTLFGWQDSIKSVKHNDELLAASQRAREQLPTLRVVFQKGLAPGEFIELKAPFHRPDGGTEWMWVEVTDWKGGEIKGLLKNEPFHIPSLHGGQIVEVFEKDIFDYLHKNPDGTESGNETGSIIEKMQPEKSPR